MLRKSQPKEAAQNVRAFLKGQGLNLSNAQSLEVIAIAGGYKDWNTMVASQGKAGEKRGALVPQKLEGPFRVIQNGKLKATFDDEDAARELLGRLISPSSRESQSGFNDVTIEAPNTGVLVRAIHPSMRYRVYVEDKLHSTFWARDEFLASLVNLRQDYGDRSIKAEFFEMPKDVDVPCVVRSPEPFVILEHNPRSRNMRWVCSADWRDESAAAIAASIQDGLDDDFGVALDRLADAVRGCPLAGGISKVAPLTLLGVTHGRYAFDEWLVSFEGGRYAFRMKAQYLD